VAGEKYWQCKVGTQAVIIIKSKHNIHSISHSPNGWTDQELGLLWLEKDFDRLTREKANQGWRLLMLDGHNSHCTYKFCKYAEANKIVVICLPPHTTHVLQPCDVGVFGPLAQRWKTEVTRTTQLNIAITKYNFPYYYELVRRDAFSKRTIIAAWKKTGCVPLNRNAIPDTAFAPATSTSTQSAQPLPAQLTSILSPSPSSTPAATPTSSPVQTPAASVVSLAALSDAPSDMSSVSMVERYYIEMPPPLKGTAGRLELRAQIVGLRNIVEQAAEVLQQNYAQMKLMDMENERLRIKLFQKASKKNKSLPVAGSARHMTSEEMLELLALEEWKRVIKAAHKEMGPRLHAQKKMITKFEREEAKRKKAEAAEAAALASEQAGSGRGRGRGRGRGHGRGRGRGRGQGTRGTRGRGRGGAAVEARNDADEGGSESSGSSTSSDSESSFGDGSDDDYVPQTRPRPRPRWIRTPQPEGVTEPASEPLLPEPMITVTASDEPVIPTGNSDASSGGNDNGGRDTLLASPIADAGNSGQVPICRSTRRAT
jgi:hypothetical protein